MSKYKHKQTGIIVESINNTALLYKFKDNSTIQSQFVEDTDDWEKMIEEPQPKEYEILSFVIVTSPTIKYTKQEDNLFHNLRGTQKYTEEQMFAHAHCVNTGDYKIRSIKRLSDGEIFTIGDKFCNNWDKNDISRHQIIKKFNINPNSLTIEVENGYIFSLDLIICIKEPLLITEDGKEYFDRNADLYIVCKKFIYTRAKVSFAIDSKDRYKYFSTESAAKEYIALNKPCISIKELRSFVKSNIKTLIGLSIISPEDLNDFLDSKLKT